MRGLGGHGTGGAPGDAAKARLVAVGGGKGGIGKSVLAAMLGVELARREARTLLVDLDLGGPNLHSLLALPAARGTLSDFVARRVDDLAGLAVATPVPGLTLIPGARTAVQHGNLVHQQRARLGRAVASLDADAVVLDLGAGTHFNVVDFFLLASDPVLIVVPEAPSVENAYRFLKVAFLRRVQGAGLGEEVKALVLEASRDGGARTPAELLAEASRRAPAVAEELRRAMATFRPLLVVNQVRGAADLALGPSMCEAARRLFGVHLELLGHLHHCELLARAVRSRLPVTPENLGRELQGDVAQLASRLLARRAREAAP